MGFSAEGLILSISFAYGHPEQTSALFSLSGHVVKSDGLLILENNTMLYWLAGINWGRIPYSDIIPKRSVFTVHQNYIPDLVITSTLNANTNNLLVTGMPAEMLLL